MVMLHQHRYTLATTQNNLMVCSNLSCLWNF